MKPAIVLPIAITASFLIAGGTVISVALLATEDVKEDANDYIIEPAFSSIDITTDSASIEFQVSEDNVRKIHYVESKNHHYEYNVEDDTLKILHADNRSIFSKLITGADENEKIIVYLPKGEYKDLKLESGDAKITVPNDFTFNETSVNLTKGSLYYSANTKGRLDIETNSADAFLSNFTSNDNVVVASSSGVTKLQNVNIENSLSSDCPIGYQYFENVRAKEIEIESSNGDILLRNVIASDALTIQSKKGEITLEDVDSASISLANVSGDINAVLLSPKTFTVSETTGEVHVPETTGDPCMIESISGNIDITIKEDTL